MAVVKWNKEQPVVKGECMKQFATSCVDTKTNMQMILSECTFNAACYWLTSRIKEVPDIKAKGDELYVIRYTSRTFLFDGKRNLLLGM